MDSLVTDTLATHHGLEERLARAKVARPSGDPHRPREEFPSVDTFLATASRHNAALLTVLVPAARSHLSDGPARAAEFVAASRRYEEALSGVKAKLYRSAQAPRQSWSQMWAEVDAAFREAWRLELALVADLVDARRDDDPDWAERLHRAELRSPTRPHPHIPHQGVAGHAARAVARKVDAFWDAAEGRMVPAPERSHDRTKDGLFVQYLLGDPHLAPTPRSAWEQEPRRAGGERPTSNADRSASAPGPVGPHAGDEPHLDGHDGYNPIR